MKKNVAVIMCLLIILLSVTCYAEGGIKGIDYSKMAENATLLYRTSEPEQIDGNYYATYGSANNLGITISYDIVIDGDELFALQLSGYPDSDNEASFSAMLDLIKDIEWGNFTESEYADFIEEIEQHALKMEKENIGEFEDTIGGLYVRMSRVKFAKYLLSIEIAADGYEDEF